MFLSNTEYDLYLLPKSLKSFVGPSLPGSTMRCLMHPLLVCSTLVILIFFMTLNFPVFLPSLELFLQGPPLPIPLFERSLSFRVQLKAFSSEIPTLIIQCELHPQLQPYTGKTLRHFSEITIWNSLLYSLLNLLSVFPTRIRASWEKQMCLLGSSLNLWGLEKGLVQSRSSEHICSVKLWGISIVVFYMFELAQWHCGCTYFGIMLPSSSVSSSTTYRFLLPSCVR